MQQLLICDEDMTIKGWHCPFCGTQTTNEKGTITPCDHLVHASVSENPEEPLFGEAPDFEDGESLDLSFADLLERKYPGEENLLFAISDPPLAGSTTVYLLYCIPR